MEKNMVSDCCGALPWKLETYELMGICSECKENSGFTEEEENEG